MAEWRPVKDYEGLYEVSSHGEVRSIDRIVENSGNWAGSQSVIGRTLSPFMSRGYKRVILSKEGFKRKMSIHRLVAEAFCNKEDGKDVVRHLNGNRVDNRASNLHWGTASENQRDSVIHGTHKETRKMLCNRGHKLEDPNLVEALKKMGKRSCRSCQAARTECRRKPWLDIQEEADRRYQKYVNE